MMVFYLDSACCYHQSFQNIFVLNKPNKVLNRPFHPATGRPISCGSSSFSESMHGTTVRNSIHKLSHFLFRISVLLHLNINDINKPTIENTQNKQCFQLFYLVLEVTKKGMKRGDFFSQAIKNTQNKQWFQLFYLVLEVMKKEMKKLVNLSILCDFFHNLRTLK